MTLRTPRLLLRELCIEDVAALNEIERDPRVTRYVSFEPRSVEQTREYIESAVREQSADPRRTYDFAVVPLNGRTAASKCPGQPPDAKTGPTGALIGRCGLGIQRPEHREAMIWYELHPTHWGKGFAVEAASAVLAYAFGTLALHRVWADCDPRNAASCRVAERLGMKYEGRLRENYFLKGEWCSTDVFAILESEWSALSGETAQTQEP